MRFRRTFAFLAFAALSALPAWAQDVKPVEVNLGAGFTIPYSDAKESFGTGGNVQLGVVFNANSVVGIQANYGYTKFGGKDIPPNFAGGVFPPDGGIVTSVPLTVNHTMHDGDFSLLLSTGGDSAAKGYAIVGGGVYHQIINVTTPSVGLATVCDPWIYICYPVPVEVDRIIGERTSTDIGINIGGGVTFKIGETAKFFAEFRYIHTYGPEITRGGSTVKANGNYFPVTFGFRM
jgi:hypothetical protein